jgi:hypothetical protein
MRIDKLDPDEPSAHRCDPAEIVDRIRAESSQE